MAQQKTISIKEALVPSLEELERNITFEGLIPESSGFKELDAMGGVARLGQLTMIAAPLEIAKLDFALNVMMNWLKLREDNSALLVNCNISNEIIIKKLWSAEGRLEVKKVETGLLDDDEQDRMMSASRYLDAIDKRLLLTNVNHIDSIISEIQKLDEQRVMVVISEVDAVKGDDILDKLQRLAIKKNIAIVVVKSLAKEGSLRPDKRSKLMDLPDNERIYVDKVLFVYDDGYYNPQSPYAGRAEIIVAKNNFGPTGSIFLAHQPDYCSFFNILKE